MRKFMPLIFVFALVGCTFSKATLEDTDIYVPGEATWEAVRDSLSGKVEQPSRVGRDMAPQTGYYKLRKGLTYRELTRIIERGWQTPVRVTFNNQPTLAALAGRVARQMEADSTEFVETFSNDSLLVSYGLNNQTFISLFLPDTYEFYWTATPREFVKKMHSRWEKFWNDAERAKKLKEIGLTPVEVQTLASIVYEETKIVDEMPRVAGVYINRLRIEMPLQADPTVKYALIAAGKPSPKRILRKHLEIDSPYNTYKNEGLPPGPISMPSMAAIDAVLNHEKHDYLYFAANPDFSGRHAFSETLAGHNRNADAYRRALDRAGIRR